MTTEESDLDYVAATAQVLAEEEDPLEATGPNPKLHVPLPNDPSPDQKAAQLRDVVPAAYVYAAAAGLFQGAVDLESCQVYLHQLLQEAGDPVDPTAHDDRATGHGPPRHRPPARAGGHARESGGGR